MSKHEQFSLDLEFLNRIFVPPNPLPDDETARVINGYIDSVLSTKGVRCISGNNLKDNESCTVQDLWSGLDTLTVKNSSGDWYSSRNLAITKPTNTVNCLKGDAAGQSAITRIILLLRLAAKFKGLDWEAPEPCIDSTGKLTNIREFCHNPTNVSGNEKRDTHEHPINNTDPPLDDDDEDFSAGINRSRFRTVLRIAQLTADVILDINKSTRLSLQTSEDRSLVSIYHRGTDDAVDERFSKSVRAYVHTAEKFIYICGRTHSKMLAKPEDDGPMNSADDGWLWHQLLISLKLKTALKLKILLGDGFSNETNFALFRAQATGPGQAKERLIKWRTEARTTAINILATIADKVPNADFELQLIGSMPVPYALLATSQTAFVEHYLPSQPGGASEVLQYFPSGSKGGSYERIKDDFEYVLGTRTGNLLATLTDFKASIERDPNHPEASLMGDLECAIEYLKDKPWSNRGPRPKVVNEVTSQAVVEKERDGTLPDVSSRTEA